MCGTAFTDTHRAKIEVIDALARHGAAAAFEARGRRGLLGSNVRPIQQGAKIAGSAVTISTPPGDNLTLHLAIDQLTSSDVLVVSTNTSDRIAFMGDLMALSAKIRGCRGIVLDAEVRDVANLREMGFPVWARGVCAHGPSKRELGQLNVPITCADVIINPGDVVVADDDGVCIVPRGEAEQTLAIADSRAVSEDEMRCRIFKGEPTMDIFGLRSVFSSSQIKVD